MGEDQSLVVDSPKISFVHNNLILILLQLFSLAPVHETCITRECFYKFSEDSLPPPPSFGQIWNHLTFFALHRKSLKFKTWRKRQPFKHKENPPRIYLFPSVLISDTTCCDRVRVLTSERNILSEMAETVQNEIFCAAGIKSLALAAVCSDLGSDQLVIWRSPRSSSVSVLLLCVAAASQV